MVLDISNDIDPIFEFLETTFASITKIYIFQRGIDAFEVLFYFYYRNLSIQLQYEVTQMRLH